MAFAVSYRFAPESRTPSATKMLPVLGEACVCEPQLAVADHSRVPRSPSRGTDQSPFAPTVGDTVAPPLMDTSTLCRVEPPVTRPRRFGVALGLRRTGDVALRFVDENPMSGSQSGYTFVTCSHAEFAEYRVLNTPTFP